MTYDHSYPLFAKVLISGVIVPINLDEIPSRPALAIVLQLFFLLHLLSGCRKPILSSTGWADCRARRSHCRVSGQNFSNGSLFLFLIRNTLVQVLDLSLVQVSLLCLDAYRACSWLDIVQESEDPIFVLEDDCSNWVFLDVDSFEDDAQAQELSPPSASCKEAPLHLVLASCGNRQCRS